MPTFHTLKFAYATTFLQQMANSGYWADDCTIVDKVLAYRRRSNHHCGAFSLFQLPFGSRWRVKKRSIKLPFYSSSPLPLQNESLGLPWVVTRSSSFVMSSKGSWVHECQVILWRYATSTWPRLGKHHYADTDRDTLWFTVLRYCFSTATLAVKDKTTEWR